MQAHESWKWYGYAGHLIVAARCAYHLCTRVGDVLVSTVGDYDRRPGSSSYRGVSFVRRDRTWRASIGHEMRKIALGEFRDEEAAARAYDAAAIRLHGEFARLNFPTLAALKEASHG